MTTKDWILDSEIYDFTHSLIGEIRPKKLLELSLSGELDTYIAETIDPYIEEYHSLTIRPNQNEKEQNTQRLMARDWLYGKLREHITKTE